MINVIANGLIRKKIINQVNIIKRSIGLYNTLKFPILNFVENILPEILEDYHFIIVPVTDMKDKHGETIPSIKTIRIREDIYERAYDGHGRDRMTVAHEVGHLFLHNNDSVALCRLSPNAVLPAYVNPEWQANAFGGELLAAGHLIVHMNPNEIEQKCSVSFDAARVQLKAAQKIYKPI